LDSLFFIQLYRWFQRLQQQHIEAAAGVSGCWQFRTVAEPERLRALALGINY
jgi:hypothetical protein